MDKMTKNYLEIIFDFLVNTEGYASQYQYAYLISTLLYNSNLRYTHYFYNNLTVDDLVLLDEYVSDNDSEGFYNFIKNYYTVSEEDII